MNNQHRRLASSLLVAVALVALAILASACEGGFQSPASPSPPISGTNAPVWLSVTPPANSVLSQGTKVSMRATYNNDGPTLTAFTFVLVRREDGALYVLGTGGGQGTSTSGGSNFTVGEYLPLYEWMKGATLDYSFLLASGPGVALPGHWEMGPAGPEIFQKATIRIDTPMNWRVE